MRFGRLSLVAFWRVGMVLFLCVQFASVQADEDTITVCTYNINWGNPDLAKTVALIESIKPDFLALQETNPESKKILTKKLKKLLPHAVFTDTGRHGAGGFGFMSRYKIDDVKSTNPQFGYFGTYRCSIAPTGKKIDIISVHLQPVLPKDGATTLEMMKMLIDTELTRKKEIESILKKEIFKSPILVVGDFNSNSVQHAPAYLRKKGLTDSFASVNKNPNSQITWQWTYRDINLRDRIDFIFHSKHFKTIRSEILKKGPSDHYPVVSRLKLAE